MNLFADIKSGAKRPGQNTLRRIRRAAGIGQAFLAKHWGISPRTLRRWEKAGEAPAFAIDAINWVSAAKRAAEETPGKV